MFLNSTAYRSLGIAVEFKTSFMGILITIIITVIISAIFYSLHKAVHQLKQLRGCAEAQVLLLGSHLQLPEEDLTPGK